MEEKKVTWLELFYDLLIVAAISTATHVLLHVEKGYIHSDYLLKFVLIFIPIWWAWVGQTMFINRYGEDLFHHRIFLILQMFFALIMIASLSVDFDSYYRSFLIGYIGLRALVVIQYLVVQLCSLFFDSWIRYLILYTGILVDILIPIIGRKRLVNVPTNTAHLFERFGLFTIILFGETLVSTLAVIQPKQGDWNSILFTIVSFVLIISMWWQYFDNLEKKVNKSIKTAGQMIIYGHLFILMSLSMIAASIRLLFMHEVNYYFILFFVFGSVLLYFLSTSIVFHQYRYKKQRLKIYHLGLFLGILVGFLILNLIISVPNILIMVELIVFFVIYAKLTTV
ncbi:low temperature requirement protein A [Lysinibacillus xylanilyticus]|uniref:Low temperature requirement protein A n=1 Tax=Lysinibacillus xylanilyticus TaxID=582475 RepID=A0A2M9Q475_9BACI|nr:low temperature requirement protein A [Lysinibacillus xylanilyticus]PJO42885.1 low temperature requirement protein A [Lysinibacillus xylanilyticus]